MNDRSIQRQDFFTANVWLLFLLFPAVTVWTQTELSSGRRWATLVVLGLFAVVHMIGYAILVRRLLGISPEPERDGLRAFLDPKGSRLWFAALSLLTGVALALAGWPILGVLPFLISFAMFHFTWPTAIVVFAASVGAAVVAPLIAGRLDELWFFVVIVLSAGGAIALTRMNEERHSETHELRTDLLLSEERDRVARDVHDVLGHSLTTIILKSQVLDRMLEVAEPGDGTIDEARRQLTEMEQVSREALGEIRATVGGIRATSLSNELAAARAVLTDAGVRLTVHGSAGAVPEPQVLAWVVRESVTNIVRHANATSCEIRLSAEGTILEVTDDGDGLREATEGHGLRGARERLDNAGLEMVIDDDRGGGTRLRVSTSGMPGR